MIAMVPIMPAFSYAAMEIGYITPIIMHSVMVVAAAFIFSSYGPNFWRASKMSLPHGR